jgi:hypothetical protein
VPDQGFRQQSALASAILERSQDYCSQASDSRLHNKVQTIGSSSNREHESSSSGSTSGFNLKNLGKANRIVAERKKKLEESKLNDTGIRIAGMLWHLEKNKLTQVNFPFFNSNLNLNHHDFSSIFNFKQITPLRILKVFEPNEETGISLDEVLLEVKTNFEKKHPDAEQLTWYLFKSHL